MRFKRGVEGAPLAKVISLTKGPDLAITLVPGSTTTCPWGRDRGNVSALVLSVRNVPAGRRSNSVDFCCPPSHQPCDPSLICPEPSEVPGTDRRLPTGIAVMIPLSIALWGGFFLIAWWLLF
jgi:hypothetical protein